MSEVKFKYGRLYFRGCEFPVSKLTKKGGYLVESDDFGFCLQAPTIHELKTLVYEQLKNQLIKIK